MSGAMNVRQKLLRGRPLTGYSNTLPVVTITAYAATPSVSTPTPGFTATAVDAESGDISSSIVWIGRTVKAAAGYNVVDVGGGVAGGTSTGLPLGSPEGGSPASLLYTATVAVDGGSAQPLVVNPNEAGTYTLLLGILNGQTTGAVWSISGGDVVCTSSTTGASSAVTISDTDLFASLSTFSAVDAPVAGVAEVYAQIGSGASATLTFGTTGSQTVTAQVTDPLYGGTGSDSETITVS